MRSLYVCYLSLDDPLTHSQVVAYLAGLAAAGHEIHLLTFEPARLTRERRRELQSSMAGRGIHWHGLRYHKRPSLPATVFDTLAGAVNIARLARRYQIDVIHARSHVPAAMGLLAMRALRARADLIFDIRGLMAEEYADAGRWKEGGLPYRLTKAVERAAIGRARGIVVLTERVRRQLFGETPRKDVWVIPCCADLDSLAPDDCHRKRMRRQLGLEDALVLVYVGKFTGWYMEEEMAHFFSVAYQNDERWRFLILTQGNGVTMIEALERHGIDSRAYTITFVPPPDMGSYLAAADAAISFIRPTPSKASSSPTKVGEYLAAGLPVVATAGVGDLDEILTPDVGALVSIHDADSYGNALKHLAALRSEARTHAMTRAVAGASFSLDAVGIPRYRELYEHVARVRSLRA